MATYKFEVGQEYIMRTGRRARVLFVDACGHAAGVILCGSGELLLGSCAWSKSGVAWLSQHSNDIVQPATTRREEIPWDCIREKYDYVAMDYSGKWFAFTGKPRVADDRIGLYWVGRNKCTLSTVRMPDSVPVTWDQTLVERPSK